MRKLIEEVVHALEERHVATGRVDLNDIAELIGSRAVSYEEVDAIISELEGRGCSVGGEPTAREMALLRDVLTTTRQLTASLGRRPTVDEIAEAIAQPSFVVRRAIENGGSFGRPRET